MSQTIHRDTATPLASRRRAFFAFPLVWLVIGAAAVALTDSALLALGAGLGPLGQIAAALLGGIVAVALYRAVMRRLARRAAPEIARAGALREGLTGSLVGAGFILASIGLVALLGGFRITWHPIDAVATVALAIGTNLGTAAVEEIVFRGLAFQAIERLAAPRRLGRRAATGTGTPALHRGTWIALAVTAAFFGAAHLLNPGATAWSGVAIAVEAGVLTGAAFVWRRSLWFVMGVHFAWNALEGLFGIAVSGHRDPGLLLTVATGPTALSGGAFGVEASVVPVVLSLAISVPMIVAAVRRDRAASA